MMISSIFLLFCFFVLFSCFFLCLTAAQQDADDFREPLTTGLAHI